MKTLLAFAAILGTTAPAFAQTTKATPSTKPASAPAAAPAPTAATAPAATAPAATAPAATAPAAATEAPAAAAPAAATEAPADVAVPLVAEPAPSGQTEWSQDSQYQKSQPAAAPQTLEGSDSQLFIGGAWDMTLPVGSSADFASVYSAQGASVQFRYQGLGRVSFGGLAAWEGWGAKGDQTNTLGSVTVGGVQMHAVWANSLYARAQAALFDIRAASSVKKPVPYAALNFGGAHTVRRVDIGIYTITEDSWHWAVAPEVGVEIPLTRVVVTAGARFNYFFSSGEGPEQLYFSFMLGLGAF